MRKQYKVARWIRNEEFEDFLNKYAAVGWVLWSITELNGGRKEVVFEKEIPNTTKVFK